MTKTGRRAESQETAEGRKKKKENRIQQKVSGTKKNSVKTALIRICQGRGKRSLRKVRRGGKGRKISGGLQREEGNGIFHRVEKIEEN